MINAFKSFFNSYFLYCTFMLLFYLDFFIVNLNAKEEVNLGQYNTLIVGDSGLETSLNQYVEFYSKYLKY